MCIACETSINLEAQDAFSGRLVKLYNDAMIVLLLSIGHRTGLFDVMADGESRTSRQLAHDAGLNERYVREWLGGLVAARIVERDAGSNTHRLPPEHAHWLHRKSPVANLAVMAQYLPTLAQAEDKVVDCFRNGGGVSYEAYPRFHEVMAEDSGQAVVAVIVDKVVPMFDGLHERLRAGIDVLDIGCGRGLALMKLAAAYPESRFTGYDLSPEVVEYARAEAGRRGLENVSYLVKDLTHWDEVEAFDWITALDAIHDQARPDKVLASIRRALRPGGHFLMMDIDASSEPNDNIDHPLGSLIYTVSTMHCMTVSLAQGGMGLGTAWGTQLAEKMLREAGFEDITIERPGLDVINAFYVMNV
ncbi:MAG: class I SAM-dependent methyltransferase [Verrucomicrobiaceae bacterium]|nr:MAG: class I SAM-dependent methyltransferase [Verrucomicrobiaceae bacterium]